MVLSPCQEVVGYLLNSAIGVACTSNRQFELSFHDSEYGVPDSLIVQCMKWFFKNGDFSYFYEDVRKMVKGKDLSSFGDSMLANCPELIKIVCENAYVKSKKIKFVIKKDEWAVSVGRGRIITFPFTKDMDEPATRLAEYTRMFFNVPSYDIEFAFEGSYGLHRNMDLTAVHILLLSKIKAEDFGEKGRQTKGRERNGRLAVRMSRIGWFKSGIYYNAIIEFFESYRGTVIVQGEQPKCRIKKTFKEILDHTLANPGDTLTDDNPILELNVTMKRKRKTQDTETEDEQNGFFALRVNS